MFIFNVVVHDDGGETISLNCSH